MDMKISSNKVGSYFSIEKKEITKQNNTNNIANLNKTSFKGEVYQAQEIKNQIGSEEKFLQDFLKRNGKVSKEEYDDIIQNHPRTLAKCYEMCETEKGDINSSVKTVAKSAVKLKDLFDNLYGKKYTVVSIGRSPAPFAEVMQNLGCNVIFLPASSLHGTSGEMNEDSSLSEIEKVLPHVKVVMDYATKKGIAEEDAGEIILLDYSMSGTSLNVMEKLMKKRGDIPPEKIHKHPLVESFSLSKNLKFEGREFSDVIFDLAGHELKNICNVPRFECNAFRNIMYKHLNDEEYNDLYHKQFDDFSQPLARAWCLCATNEAMKLIQ